MVSTPVMAFGSTPAGTGTAKLLVLTVSVDIVPGTVVLSAQAGSSGTVSSAQAGRVARRAAVAHAERRRRSSSRAPRTRTSPRAVAVATEASLVNASRW